VQIEQVAQFGSIVYGDLRVIEQSENFRRLRKRLANISQPFTNFWFTVEDH